MLAVSEIELHAMASRNGFTRRWAIRLPDGSLYTGQHPRAAELAAEAAAKWHAMSSAERDMRQYQAAMFGQRIGEPQPPAPAKPIIFDSRADAEKLYRDLCDAARLVGVQHWGGAIVESLCTPFTSADPAVQFAEQITAWVAENGGDR